MTMPKHAMRLRFPVQLLAFLHAEHLSGPLYVIQQRRRTNEALVAHQLLGVKTAIRTPKDAVTFGRHLTQAVIDRHAVLLQRFPRRACSASIASNSARKLPLPKPLLPALWMISKNRVGRSSTGLV